MKLFNQDGLLALGSSQLTTVEEHIWLPHIG
jgi:hypothetical protein